jgi:hypothetical protein
VVLPPGGPPGGPLRGSPGGPLDLYSRVK